MEPYLASWNGSELLAHQHSEADVACLDCHEPTIKQQVEELVSFVTNNYETPLEEREFDQEWCLRCHEHGSSEEVIEMTADLDPNPHKSHIGDLECGLCHNVHRESEDYCAECHGPLGTGAEWVNVTEPHAWWSPNTDCSFCHAMTSYTESLQDSTLLVSVHAQQGLTCLDCHESTTLEQVHNEAVATGSSLKPRYFESELCLDCHKSNDHSNIEEIIERTKDFQVEGEMINPHDPHTNSDSILEDEVECYSCHKMHKASPGINGCFTCHHQGHFASCSSAGCHEGETP